MLTFRMCVKCIVVYRNDSPVWYTASARVRQFSQESYTLLQLGVAVLPRVEAAVEFLYSIAWDEMA